MPSALEPLCTDDPHERAGHAYGKSYRDLVRALRREFPEPPDLVALPGSEQDVVAILDWCTGSRIAVVPYGGGSSVVGGVEPDVGERFAGVVSLDLRRLGRVLQVDERSRAAEVEAGVLGPVAGGAAAAARPHVPALPPVVRVLHPRRLDRDSLRWALRHRPHPRRRARRSADVSSTPAGDAGDAAATGGWRGPVARASLLRLRGRARRHHPRLDPAAGARGASRRVGRALRPVRGRGRGRRARLPSRACGRRTAVYSTTRKRSSPAAATGRAAIIVLGFESADRPRRRGARARRGALPRARRVLSVTAWRRRRGARRSSGCRTCTRPSCDWGCSPAASRRRSRGTGSRSSTPPSPPRSRKRAGPRAGACSSRAGSPTSIRTGRPRTTRSSRPPGPARSWSSGTRSRRRSRGRSSTTAARSPTTTLSGATTGPWYDEERPHLFADALRAAKHALDPAGILNPGVLID